MKKLIFIFIMLIGYCFNVSAKELIIDDIVYDDTKNISGKGYFYNKSLKTIYLNNYYGGVISYNDKITITVEKDSVINGKNDNVGLNVDELLLNGDGNLYIRNVSKGIKSEKLTVNKSTIIIDAIDCGIESTNGMNLSEAKIKINSSNIGFCIRNFINIQFSKINVDNSTMGIDMMDNLNISIDFSSLYINSLDLTVEADSLRSSQSYIYLKSDYKTLNNLIIMKSTENRIFVSNDNNSYYIDDNYKYYPYLKLGNNQNIESLLLNDDYTIFNIDKDSILENAENEKIIEIDEDTEKVYTPNSISENKNVYTANVINKFINPKTSDNIFHILIFLIVNLIILFFMKGKLYVRKN